jgi:hypothetical protein
VNELEVGSGFFPVLVTVAWHDADLVAVSPPYEVLVGSELDDTSGAWLGEQFWGSSLGGSGSEHVLVLADFLGSKGHIWVFLGLDSLGLLVEEELLVGRVLSLLQHDLALWSH